MDVGHAPGETLCVGSSPHPETSSTPRKTDIDGGLLCGAVARSAAESTRSRHAGGRESTLARLDEVPSNESSRRYLVASHHRCMTPSLIRCAGTLLLLSTFASAAAQDERFAVFKSTDRGRSWIRSDAGMPNRSRINAFGAVPGVLFAGTDSGIFVSNDDARNWRPASGATLSLGRVTSIAAIGNTVFAGTDSRGLWVSTNQGGSWIQDAGFRSKKIRCLIVRDGTVYAGTDAEGVMVSNGEGTRWVRRQEGLPDHAQVFALSVVAGRLFAGLYSHGLFVWNEPEGRWTKSGPVSPLALSSAGRTLIAGHNPGGLHWSADLGTTWSRGKPSAADPVLFLQEELLGELSEEAPVWELASNDEVALAGASKGVYRSEDHGRTWVRVQGGLPDRGPGVAFLVNQSIVLAGLSISVPDLEP